MRRCLIKTLYFENGELYVTMNGRRVLLANCKPKVEIYEDRYRVNTIGTNGYGVKKMVFSLVICSESEFTRDDIDIELLGKIKEFDLSADIQRTDGVFERIDFYKLIPDELDIDGEWSFDISHNSDILRKLLCR